MASRQERRGWRDTSEISVCGTGNAGEPRGTAKQRQVGVTTQYRGGIVSAPGAAVPSPSYEIARCVVCGHADASVVADADAMHAEVESLWEYHEKRLKPGTPTRRLMDRVAF